MENMDKIMDGLSEEILRSIKDMSKSDHLEERKVRAETIKALCESMGVFYTAISEAADRMDMGFDPFDDEFDDDDDDPDRPIPF